MTWIALHVFSRRGERAIDRLVLEGVQPIVEQELEAARLERWFFVRDGGGGRQLELCLRPRAAGDVAPIREALAACLREIDPDATITEASCGAEAERFGGAAGLAISELLFLESSRVAVAVLRHAPDRRQRLVGAVQLILAMIGGLGLTPLRAVAWLRQPAADADGVDATQLASASFMAEQEFFAHEEAWLRLRPGDRRGDGPGSSSVARYWQEAVVTAARGYRALDDATADALDAVWRRHLRLLLNRLGLAAAAAHRVGWLASLVLARTHAQARPSDDGVDAFDRAYHEHSKLTGAVSTRDQEPTGGAVDAVTAAGSPADGARAVRFAELDPATAGPALSALAGLLCEQKTARYRGPLALDRLALVLGLATSRATSMAIIAGGRRHELRRPIVPPAGARQPIRMYVVARDVTGLAPGIYAYHEADHALCSLGAAPDRASLLRAVPSLAGRLDEPLAVDAADAPAILVHVADLSRQREHHGLRGYRLLHLACGHQAQNVCLVATALGLSCTPIASFFDDMLAQLLGVDGVNWAPLYVMPLGPDPA